MLNESSKGTVLVVDDSRESRELMAIYLSGQGYRVLKAPSGPSALELVEQDRPDVIVLDIMMPEMDGYEVTTALRHNDRNKTIPIILASAKSTADDVLAGLLVGADDYITKPFDLDILLARIQIQLRVRALRERMVAMEGVLARTGEALTALESGTRELIQALNGGNSRKQAEAILTKLSEVRANVRGGLGSATDLAGGASPPR